MCLLYPALPCPAQPRRPLPVHCPPVYCQLAIQDQAAGLKRRRHLLSHCPHLQHRHSIITQPPTIKISGCCEGGVRGPEAQLLAKQSFWLGLVAVADRQAASELWSQCHAEKERYPEMRPPSPHPPSPAPPLPARSPPAPALPPHAPRSDRRTSRGKGIKRARCGTSGESDM